MNGDDGLGGQKVAHLGPGRVDVQRNLRNADWVGRGLFCGFTRCDSLRFTWDTWSNWGNRRSELVFHGSFCQWLEG